MKRLVATYGIGQLLYLRPAVESMRAYCSQVGADFWEIKFFPEAGEYGESPAWLHIEALKRFRAQTYYDELLLLDADVLILPRRHPG
jgi:hypothetical protein